MIGRTNHLDIDGGYLHFEPEKCRATILLCSYLGLGLSLSMLGCGTGLPSNAVVGRAGVYDYSPSMIQTGNVQQFWWCGQAKNPADSSQDTDTILYESINTATRERVGPLVVLAETPGTWDQAYTCNPRVVRGSFTNPLNDGNDYTYVMYYVATALLDGSANSIGAAFSSDGILWHKYAQPVIATSAPSGSGTFQYGVGQPAIYNTNKKAALIMFYEDYTPSIHHVEATSTDGIHFTVQGTLTTNGLDANNSRPSWGDMAYDSATKSWYAMFDLDLRDPATTGGVQERGQLGAQLYRIAEGSVLSGATPWEQLKTFDTNLTGYECLFIPGLLHNQYGDVNIGSYPTIKIFTSFSNEQPHWDATPSDASSSCRISTWDIGLVSWAPGGKLVALNAYYNDKVHEVTTGWIDPEGGFQLQSTIGHLYEASQSGATVPFYGCKTGSTDYFVSTDSTCGGARILGLDGYGYSQPVAGLNLISLYRCSSGHDHFVSKDPKCEGQTTEQILGYALP